MKLKYCLLAILLPMLNIMGQSPNAIKALSIGDTVPDMVFENMINYKTGSAKLSDFKGKLVIIDFWATWCSACIKNFPKMYDLQIKFKEQCQILLVNTKSTNDDKFKIESFFNKRQNSYQLPSVINDTILNFLFPHKSIPHYVWLKDNKVKAITSAEQINQKNINAILNNEEFKGTIKNDIEFDFKEPLFINGNGGMPDKYIFRSILSGYMDGLVSSNGVIYEKDKTASRIFNTNTSILNLYLQAYPEFGNYPINRIIFDVPNPSDFSLDSNSYSWKSKNLYNYELSFPPQKITKALKLMRDDLSRYFNLFIHAEDREVTCLVLTLENKKSAQFQSSAKPETNIYEEDTSPKYLKNYPLIVLINHLNTILKTPIIDETNFFETVDINLPADLSNEDLLMDSLKKYGFVLSKEKRELSFLIISADKSSN